LKRGISDCFSIRNFSIDKPDSSAYFVSIWNSFCDEFYRNFIKNAQWSYLAKGLLTTIEITLLAALFGILIGFICAIVRCTYEKTGKLMILDQIVRLYLTVIRGTPLMIQLMIIYFVLLLPVGIEKFPAAVLCFSINSGAYVAEIVRGGIMSVDGGQIEAGRSLGLNYIQTMYHIVVPQAFKAVLPSLANEFITLLKESSVAFYIGVADLTQGGLKIRSITYSNFMPLIAVAVIYLVMVLILTRLVGILERRLRKDER
jgi:His/Glu/Gln/Arg/opine family amino acid ABC transporter permease subunit